MLASPWLTGNSIEDEGAKALAAALEPRQNPDQTWVFNVALQKLILSCEPHHFPYTCRDLSCSFVPVLACLHFNGRWWIIQVQEMYVLQSIMRMIEGCQAASNRRRWCPRGSQGTGLELRAPRPSPLPWSRTRAGTRPGCSTGPCRSLSYHVSLTIFHIHVAIFLALSPSSHAAIQRPVVDHPGPRNVCAAIHLEDDCSMSSMLCCL